MARQNLWSNSVPRAELDHRARDARVRLAQNERLLVPRAAPSFWLGPLVRLLGSRTGGNARKNDRGSGSQSNPRLGGMSEIEAIRFKCRRSVRNTVQARKVISATRSGQHQITGAHRHSAR